MSNEIAFLTAIRDERVLATRQRINGVARGEKPAVPDTSAVVYADWLDDNGQANRAEFIRLAVEFENIYFATEPADLRRKAEIRTRMESIREATENEWRAMERNIEGRFCDPLRDHDRLDLYIPPQPITMPMAIGIPYRENLVELGWSFASLSGPPRIIEYGTDFSGINTLQVRRYYRDEMESFSRLLRSKDLIVDELAVVSVMEEGHVLNSDQIWMLVENPVGKNLRKLTINNHLITLYGLEILADAELPNLFSLDLSNCNLSTEHIYALTSGGGLINLRELKLSGNNISAPGASMLRDFTSISELQILDLSFCNMRNLDALIFRADAQAFLRELNLYGNNIDEDRIINILHNSRNLERALLTFGNAGEPPQVRVPGGSNLDRSR